MSDFVKWAGANLGNAGVCILALAVFVQITPIRISPITWLFRKIGNLLNADLKQEIAALKSDVDGNEKDRIRFEVLDFANSCRNGRRHSKDEFEHIVAIKDKYEKLLARTGDTNGVFDVEYEFILERFRMCQRENRFL